MLRFELTAVLLVLYWRSCSILLFRLYFFVHMLDFVFRVVIVVDILSYQIFNPFQTACFEPSLEMKTLQNPKSCHWEIFENWCLIWVQFPRKVLLQEFYITKTSSSEVIFKGFSIRFEETKCENASRMITIDNLSFKLHYVLSWMLQLHLWYKRIVPAFVSGNPICEIFSFLFALNELYGKDFPLPSTPCRVTRILSTHKWEYAGELLCRFSPWTTFFLKYLHVSFTRKTFPVVWTYEDVSPNYWKSYARKGIGMSKHGANVEYFYLPQSWSV